MKTGTTESHRGMSLLESVVAIGLLAITLPVSMMALGHCASLARQTRFHGSAQWCLNLDARHVREAIARSAAADKSLWVEIHADDGTFLRSGDETDHRDGVAEVKGRAAHHLVVIERLAGDGPAAGSGRCSRVRITLEEPACRPAGRRQCLSFHSAIRLP
ncbi:MAG TPA: hypothetical protein VFY13_02345 [Luteolibacter sp.]|nr:hypothetical protein [Luteolibacter sp.]